MKLRDGRGRLALWSEYVRRSVRCFGHDELLRITSVSIAVRDGQERVLLVRHSEGGVWLLPGGAIEPTEVTAHAAIRETFQQTGLLVRLTRLVGVRIAPNPFCTMARRWTSM